MGAANRSTTRTLARLRKGDRFSTPSRVVTAAEIVGFAVQTGDMHPLHVDPEWAAGSDFEEQVASGAFVLSCTIGLVRLDPRKVIAMRGIKDVVFIRPVKIGDTISVTGRVSSVTSYDACTSLVTLTMSTENQHGKPVCRTKLQILWRDQPDPAQGLAEARG